MSGDRLISGFAVVGAVGRVTCSKPIGFAQRQLERRSQPLQHQVGLDRAVGVGGLTASGRSAGRRPRGDHFLDDLQLQAAASAQSAFVLGPVRRRVSHLREVVAAVDVLVHGCWA